MLGGGGKTGLCTVCAMGEFGGGSDTSGDYDRTGQGSGVGCGDSGHSSDGERMGQGGGVSCGGDRVVTARQAMVSRAAKVVVLCVKVKTPNGAAEAKAEVEAEE